MQLDTVWWLTVYKETEQNIYIYIENKNIHIYYTPIMGLTITELTRMYIRVQFLVPNIS